MRDRKPPVEKCALVGKICLIFAGDGDGRGLGHVWGSGFRVLGSRVEASGYSIMGLKVPDLRF